MRKKIAVLVLLGLCVGLAAFAEETVPESLVKAIDMIWLIVTGSLVFFMQAGFALVETGLTRAKNATNIIMKNLMDFCFGSIVFWMIGWGLMYGVDKFGGFVGFSDFFKGPMGDPKFYRNWFFQAVFAATAATFVSGAMAERTQFKSYLIYTCFISAFIYPVSGHWIWGGGWLSKLGFHDFAGSTVVHSVGGWAALMFSWFWFKKPDASMTMNGCLAGLVAITAPCGVVSPGAAVVIGLIAGILVVLAVELIDKIIKVDDPVGAVSVHLVNGVFGTLAVGIWGNVEGVALGVLHGGGFHQLGVQALGVATVGAWAGGTSLKPMRASRFSATCKEARGEVDYRLHSAAHAKRCEAGVV